MKNLRKNIKNPILYIIILSFVVKYVYFTGYVGANPQDESMYLKNAVMFYNGDFFKQFEEYYEKKDMLDADVMNPSRTKPLALSLIIPVGMILKILGFSMRFVPLWNIITSTGSIIVAYLLGKKLFDQKVGALAALLLVFFPLEVFFSTRVQIDSTLGFFTGLAGYYWVCGLDALRSNASKKDRLAYVLKLLKITSKPTKKKHKKKKRKRNQKLFKKLKKYLEGTRLFSYNSKKRAKKKGEKQKTTTSATILFFLSGLSFSLAYYAGPRAVLFAPFLLLSAMYIIFHEKTVFVSPVSFVIGFIIPFLIVASVYNHYSGEPFLYEKMRSKANLFQYTVARGIQTVDVTDSFRILYNHGRPFFYIEKILRFIQHPYEDEFHLSGFWYPVLFLCILLSLLYLRNYKILLLTAWIVTYLILSEFGWIGFGVTTSPKFYLEYHMILKHERYLMPVNIPMVVLISAVLAWVYRKKNRLIPVIAVLFLILHSIPLLEKNQFAYVRGVNDARNLLEFMHQHPGKDVYMDNALWNFMRTIDSPNSDRYHSYDRANVMGLNDVYLVDGGSRNSDLIADSFERGRPDILDNPPDTWVKMLEVEGDTWTMRKRNMVVYLITDEKNLNPYVDNQAADEEPKKEKESDIKKKTTNSDQLSDGAKHADVKPDGRDANVDVWMYKYVDIDGDGLETDKDNMLLYIDLDGDGFYNHRVRTRDTDGDGDADYEVMFPTYDRDNDKWRYFRSQSFISSRRELPQWHLELDLDDDNVLNYDKVPFYPSDKKDISPHLGDDFMKNETLLENARVINQSPWGTHPGIADKYTDPEDVDGDNLHSHRTVQQINDTRYGYETHCFYDLDADGLTEMHIRIQNNYNGLVHAFRWDMDVDNDNVYTDKEKGPRDWDISLSGWSEEGIDQSQYGFKIPFNITPQWVLDQKWDNISLTVSHADRCSRWEGLFGFFVYVKGNWDKIETMQKDITMECDCDSSGGLKLYKFKGEDDIHLLGAEKAIDSTTKETYLDKRGDGIFTSVIDENNSEWQIPSKEVEIFSIKELLSERYDVRHFFTRALDTATITSSDCTVSESEYFLHMDCQIASDKELQNYEVQIIAYDNVDYNILATLKGHNVSQTKRYDGEICQAQFIYPKQTKLFLRVVGPSGRTVYEKKVADITPVIKLQPYLSLAEFTRMYRKPRGHAGRLKDGDRFLIKDLKYNSINEQDKSFNLSVIFTDRESNKSYAVYSRSFKPGFNSGRVSLDLGNVSIGEEDTRPYFDGQRLHLPDSRSYTLSLSISDGEGLNYLKFFEGGRLSPYFFST